MSTCPRTLIKHKIVFHDCCCLLLNIIMAHGLLGDKTKMAAAFAECRVIADLLFILDGSGSVDQPNWNQMVQFVSDLLDDLNIDLDQTHVALMTYSDSVDIAFFLTDRTDGRADVREGLEQVRTIAVTVNGTIHVRDFFVA